MENCSLQILRERVTFLDKGIMLQGCVFPFSDPLAHFSEVMQLYVNTSLSGRPGRFILDAHEADDIVSASTLLASIAHDEPRLTAGPLDISRQHWIGASRDSGVLTQLNRRNFRDPRRCKSEKASIKPLHFGLYTSTATARGHGMWRIVLESYATDLFPLPWNTWRIDIDAGHDSIEEITGASDWANFVEKYPMHSNGLVYPNWPVIAEHVSAVHITLPAIAAIQGFYLEGDCGLIAPAFWDVEQTLWLRWEFSHAEQIEVTTHRSWPFQDQ